MKRPELVIEGGEMSGRRFALKDGATRLGRSSSNDIHIPDEELSRNHCLFETVGESGLRITDLASANGTYVNGHQLGGEAVELKPGDLVEAGKTRLVVVAEGASPAAAAPAAPFSGKGVDLGLGTRAAPASAGEGGGPAAPRRPRSRFASWLWIFTVSFVLLVGCFFFFGPEESAPSVASVDAPPVKPVDNRVRELRYEKVAADSQSAFRYYMTLTADGVLKVTVDDVSSENRHVQKTTALGTHAIERLTEILSDPELEGMDREYVGPEGDPPSLSSWTLDVLRANRVKSVRIVNTPEPDAFRRVREKLEAFTKNELGIWAIQYSRDKLVELAAESAENGRVKWEDRDVEHGNLHASVVAYREALFYLETVNPKPKEYNDYRERMEQSQKELDKRFEDQSFIVNRALNMQDWTTARAELQKLCELVADRECDRYREAAAKLVDVEKRLRKGNGK